REPAPRRPDVGPRVPAGPGLPPGPAAAGRADRRAAGPGGGHSSLIGRKGAQATILFETLSKSSVYQEGQLRNRFGAHPVATSCRTPPWGVPMTVPPIVEAWSTYRTGTATQWTPRQLVRAKGGASVSVVIPARNEEATVGAIVATIRKHLMGRSALV